MEWDKKKQGVDKDRAAAFSKGFMGGGNAYAKIMEDDKAKKDESFFGLFKKQKPKS
jgi:hypothetical protein